MAKCKDCVHFPVCETYTDPNESYPEVGGCPVFKSKGNFVEVVRCKDCKYYRERKNTEMAGIKFCYRLKDRNGEYIGYNYADDDFCSYGERREGE